MTLHLDLCSGIGGFALAARWHGMTTIGFCEIDPFCRRVIRKHWPETPIHDDLTTLDAGTVREWLAETTDLALANAGRERQSTGRLGGWSTAASEGPDARVADGGGDRLDLITGGYPCQPFSLAGKRLGAEDDRHLWPYIAALVADLRPTWGLFENVNGHVTLGLDRVLADLEEIGYACRPVVVPACAVNAPHRRDRVWLIAHRDGERLEERRQRDGEPIRGEQASQRSHAGGCGEALAHADQQRGHWPRSRSSRRGEPSDSSDVANGIGFGSQGQQSTGTAPRTTERSGRGVEAQPGLGQQTDGLPRLLDGRLARPWDGGWENGVPRVTEGCVDRVNKLKALGNAIVPQVAYVLMGAMLEAA